MKKAVRPVGRTAFFRFSDLFSIQYANQRFVESAYAKAQHSSKAAESYRRHLWPLRWFPRPFFPPEPSRALNRKGFFPAPTGLLDRSALLRTPFPSCVQPQRGF
ncbi:MAG TPA: hypothetical protein IAB57_05575 [Candidatus Fimivivens faecavium]|nr:hypothetical protein [Candidatus Fimivivens faecavium]